MNLTELAKQVELVRVTSQALVKSLESVLFEFERWEGRQGGREAPPHNREASNNAGRSLRSVVKR